MLTVTWWPLCTSGTVSSVSKDKAGQETMCPERLALEIKTAWTYETSLRTSMRLWRSVLVSSVHPAFFNCCAFYMTGNGRISVGITTKRSKIHTIKMVLNLFLSMARMICCSA